MVYSVLSYKVWVSMKDIHFFVHVSKEAISVMGERNAVEYEVWKHLFNAFEAKDASGKNVKIPTASGTLLRQWAKYSGYTDFSDGVNDLKSIVMDNIHFECITIDGRA